MKGRGHISNTEVKYFVHCDPSSIKQLVFDRELIHLNKKDATIIKAVLSNYQSITKQKNIVLKIGSNTTNIQKEYDISHRLQSVPGYLKYICVFDCLDDTHKTKSTAFCESDNTDEEKKVLLAPFVKHGSIRYTKWENRYDKLRSIIKQVIMSSLDAFTKFGFLHNDLHFDNILFSDTRKRDIIYDNDVKIPSYGCKATIIDYDMSFINTKTDHPSTIIAYWQNLTNFLIRFAFDLNHDEAHSDGLSNIHSFLNQAVSRHTQPITSSPSLLSMVDSLVFRPKQALTSPPVYNPLVL